MSEDVVQEVCDGMLDGIDSDTPMVWEDDDGIPTTLIQASGGDGLYISTGIASID